MLQAQEGEGSDSNGILYVEEEVEVQAAVSQSTTHPGHRGRIYRGRAA